MDKNKLIEVIFQSWAASIHADPKKRGKKNQRPNFENLFTSWKDAGATFNDLHDNWLQKALDAHKPKKQVAKNTYERQKKNFGSKLVQSEKEFIDDWFSNIEAEGTEIFFEFFPATPLDHDPEPKVYGSMSATEYRAQRRYAEQFPTLDTRELVKQWREQKEYNIDVEDVLENVLGESDETNS